MPITDGPGGTPADTATIWDLAEAFAVLARVNARNCTVGQAQHLLEITDRLQRRALLLEREGLADHLGEAKARLGNAID